MTLLISSPATVSVTSFPYSLPASGQASLIGNNFAEDVRPPSHSAYQWNYALFLLLRRRYFRRRLFGRRRVRHCRLRGSCARLPTLAVACSTLPMPLGSGLITRTGCRG